MSDDRDYIEGIRNQLPTYLRRRKAKVGIFILFYINNTHKSINEIKKEIEKIILDNANEFFLSYLIIDLTKRPTPSKIVSYQELINIPGVGSARAESLYKAGFVSKKKILDSTIEAICSKTGLSEGIISKIKNECEDENEKSHEV